MDKEYETNPRSVCISPHLILKLQKAMFFLIKLSSFPSLRDKSKINTRAHSEKSNYIFPFNIDVVQNVYYSRTVLPVK